MAATMVFNYDDEYNAYDGDEDNAWWWTMVFRDPIWCMMMYVVVCWCMPMYHDFDDLWWCVVNFVGFMMM